MLDPETIRARGDRELAEKLQADPIVKKAVTLVEREEEKGPKGIRRQLLSSSLRLTPSMSPEIDEIRRECAERLRVEIPVETYVYPSASFNAGCIKPEAGRLFIMLSSSLLEAFRGDEMRFVMGHELGHHIFGHHDIPLGVLLRGPEPIPPALALRVFGWSRYAEISADRAGAVCTSDRDAVARALFRLASGLAGDLSNVKIDEFTAQIDEIKAESIEGTKGAPMTDWFSTHPFSPLRLKALRLFYESPMARGEEGGEELEAQVQTLMALMEPSYLQEKSEVAETMRRLLMSGAVTVADASDGISDLEREAFEAFFGEGSFRDTLNVEALKKDLPNRVADAKEKVPLARRIQVLRDLCVIARAEKIVTAKEREVLTGIAGELEVSLAVLEQTLRGDVELD